MLVQCAPVSLIPCFSVVLAPSDRTGKPVPVALPSRDRLLQSVQIESDGARIAPFYFSSGFGRDSSQRPNVVLIEVDISGSMNSLVSPEAFATACCMPRGPSRRSESSPRITSFLPSVITMTRG
jgi:hypothetical protein